ncbi:MAG: Flp pilus assembly protein CpaB [Bdellovibrionaceae bacterium]|nr:Flp pilus assembly protein CpaB [Pseudobdellovibrionaceae bacterium]
MENNETKTLWISVGAAIFAVFLLYSWSQEQKAALHKKFGSKVQVVVASKDIAEMEPIDESMLEMAEMPEDFKQPEAIQNPETVIGQMAAAPIKKGEQILNTKLLLPGKESGLSMQVTPGKRAHTIPIDDMRGVAKLIKPGDRIDLVAAVDTGSGLDKKKEVRTIMQDVPVLAVGQNIVDTVPAQIEVDGKDNFLLNNLRKVSNFTSVTIEGSPTEVQLLIYILSTSPGSLFVILRNPNDRYINPLKTVDNDDVMGKVKASRIPATPAPVVPVPTPAPAAPPRKKKLGAYEEI